MVRYIKFMKAYDKVVDWIEDVLSTLAQIGYAFILKHSINERTV